MSSSKTPDEMAARLLDGDHPGLETPPPPEIKGPLFVVDEKVLEETRKWNEERLQRKAQEEYARSIKFVQDVITENLDATVNLNAIRVIGLRRTSDSFVAKLLAPYLAEKKSETSLKDILAITSNVSGKFSRFNAFRVVDATLEKSPSVLAGPQDVDIILQVKETPERFLKLSTDVGDQEASCSATARLSNAFGQAEIIEGNASFGSKTTSSFNLRYEQPINASPDTLFELSAHSTKEDLSFFASAKEYQKSLAAKLKTLTRFGQHEFTYQATLRNVAEFSPQASLSMRNSAGDNIKSSLSHTVMYDSRDDSFAATRGLYYRLKQEYAGLGGDVNLLKFEQDASVSHPISKNSALSLGARTGLLLSLAGPSHFCDRFHIGGPTNVRMFRHNSMGPRDRGDYIGGDIFWAGGLSLLTPFAPKPEWPIKSHFFVNAGYLGSLNEKLTIKKQLNNMVTKPSVTVGCGLVYSTSSLRLEGNVGVPLTKTKGEGSIKGLQLGLGIYFL